jgi:hypothetical protein
MPLSAKSALAKDRVSARVIKSGFMQHRHFAYIAGIISRVSPDKRLEIARLFADYLRSTNDNFDTFRFLAATGIDTVEYETILRDQESLQFYGSKGKTATL